MPCQLKAISVIVEANDPDVIHHIVEPIVMCAVLNFREIPNIQSNYWLAKYHVHVPDVVVHLYDGQIVHTGLKDLHQDAVSLGVESVSSFGVPLMQIKDTRELKERVVGRLLDSQ